MLKKGILTLFIGLLLINRAVAGPFGTAMNDPREKFEDCTKIDESMCQTQKVPKKHSAFKEYILIFGSNGLSKIVGVSSNYTNNKYGEEALLAYNKLKEQVTEKYGSPKSYEYLKKGALWHEPQYFVQSLYQNERTHGCAWVFKDNIDNISEINLILRAVSSSTCIVLLQYTYKNFKEFQDNLSVQEKEAL